MKYAVSASRPSPGTPCRSTAFVAALATSDSATARPGTPRMRTSPSTSSRSGRCSFEDRLRQSEHPRLELQCRLMDGISGCYRAAACDRSDPEGDHRSVAADNLNLLKRHAERIGGDLRAGRAIALERPPSAGKGSASRFSHLAGIAARRG